MTASNEQITLKFFVIQKFGAQITRYAFIAG